MSAIDIVKVALAAVEAGDFKKADGVIADDMVFAGPVPEPLGKQEFLGVQKAMLTAMPDWSSTVQTTRKMATWLLRTCMSPEHRPAS